MAEMRKTPCYNLPKLLPPAAKEIWLILFDGDAANAGFVCNLGLHSKSNKKKTPTSQTRRGNFHQYSYSHPQIYSQLYPAGEVPE